MPTYDESFFAEIEDGSRRSAREMVSLVTELVQPRSVIDIGCGTGVWLEIFTNQGIEDILGVDGSYIIPSSLRIPVQKFLAHDLRLPLRIDRKFDLVVSLEVAEHLPPECADVFVDSLSALGPVVLFSAAVPMQDGLHHLNMQWQDYWAEKFSSRGYSTIDCIRKVVWNNPNIDWWYAQNTLIYVRTDALPYYPALHQAQMQTVPGQLAIVHPRHFMDKARLAEPVVAMRRTLASLLPGGAGAALRRLVRRPHP